MNYLINLYSIFVGKAFAFAYSRARNSQFAYDVTPALLEHYRSTRRRLPLMSDGNHLGNHMSYATFPNGEYAKNIFGGYDSFHATQGQKPYYKTLPLKQRVQLAYHDYRELLGMRVWR